VTILLAAATAGCWIGTISRGELQTLTGYSWLEIEAAQGPGFTSAGVRDEVAALEAELGAPLRVRRLVLGRRSACVEAARPTQPTQVDAYVAQGRRVEGAGVVAVDPATVEGTLFTLDDALLTAVVERVREAPTRPELAGGVVLSAIVVRVPQEPAPVVAIATSGPRAAQRALTVTLDGRVVAAAPPPGGTCPGPISGQRSPSSRREMTTFWISVVPPPRLVSFASRQARSTGKSLM
jgi:hypothetical protein